MSTFDEKFNQIITELAVGGPRRNILWPSTDGNIVFEDVYFHTLPAGFTRAFYNVIKKMYDNRIPELELDIRNALKEITENDVKNFKKFYQFIEALANSTNPKIIIIRIGNENSYSEPIELYELTTEIYKNPFNNKPFKEKQIEKLKTKVFNNALEQLKIIIDDIENFGELTFNINSLKEFYEVDNNRYDSEDSFIGHELRHFLIFLQRLSATCYDVCSHKSDKKFIKTRRSFIDKYQLNENEFITLSATYIERLINFYKKFKRDDISSLDDIKQLIRSVLVKTDLYPKTLLHDDFYWYNKLNEIKSINMITNFYKNCIEERNYKFENNIKSKKDKYLTLMKWTLKSFETL